MNAVSWTIEEIPDADMIFRRVHIYDLLNWSDLDQIQPNIFRSDPDGMTVNWNKYENRAHASVLGITPSTKTKARKKLSMIASWTIRPIITKDSLP